MVNRFLKNRASLYPNYIKLTCRTFKSGNVSLLFNKTDAHPSATKAQTTPHIPHGIPS